MNQKRVVDPKRLWKDDRQPKIAKATSLEQKSFSQISSLLFPLRHPQKHQKLISGYMKMNEKIRYLSNTAGSFVVGVVGMQGVGKTTIVQHLSQQQKKSLQTTNGIDIIPTADGIIFLDSQPILSKQDNDFEITSFLFSVCHLIIVVIEYHSETEVLEFFKEIMEQIDLDALKWKPEIVFVITKCPVFIFRCKYGNSIGDVISKYLDPILFRDSTLKAQQYWNPEFLNDVSSEDEEIEFVEESKVSHGPWKIYAIPNSKCLQRFPTKEELTDIWSLSVRYEVAIDDFCSHVKSLPRLPAQDSPFMISEIEWYRMAMDRWAAIQSKGNG
jgi:GTPase SAR1 family protein